MKNQLMKSSPIIILVVLLIGFLSFASIPNQKEAVASTASIQGSINIELLPYQSAGYKYLIISQTQTPPPGYEQPNFDDSSWNTGTAPFGSGPQGGGCSLQYTVQTNWPTDTDLLVRKTISIPSNATNVRILLGIDNDIVNVYFNGIQVSGTIPHLFCPELDNFTIQVPSSIITSGTNVVTFHARDLGGESFFDTRILMDTIIAPPCNSLPAGLVSWWPGDGNANDIVGGNNGTLQNGVSFASGKVNQGFSFDGVDDHIKIASTSTLNPTSSFSLDAWIFPTADVSGNIISKWGDSASWDGHRAYLFQVLPGGKLGFSISDVANQLNSNFHSFNSSAGVIVLNTWSHVAAVYNQSTGTRRMYVNGQQVAERTDPPITITNSIADVGIGAHLSSPIALGLPFAGLIDEVDLFNRALSVSEIQTIYNAGSAGKCGTANPCTIICPTNITVQNTANQCGRVVNYAAPTATGNCGAITCSPTFGSFFPVGTTTVTCTANSGANCSFTVTVQDTQPPTITCPANIVITENPQGSGLAVVNYALPNVSDNCSGATVNCAPSSGSTFQLGVTAVSCTAIDGSGNTAACSFSVTVTGPSLFGKIGIWDGSFWPLDGNAIRSIKLRATRVSDGTTSNIDATLTKPGYRFDNLPPGFYNLILELEYFENIQIDNSGDCLTKKEGGCSGQSLRKTVKKTVSNVQVPSLERQDIKFPLPLVMVHGILSCFEKWYSIGNSNEARSHWDNFARERGFICLTPNYRYVIRDDFWSLPASIVQLHIEESFKSLTSKASVIDYPRWVYIGHSQGGLILRMLINNNPGPLVSKLRKIFLLGTPNSGALDPILTGLSCFRYLSEGSMQSNFNLNYPTFGSKDITAYAGTRQCNIFGKDCLPAPTSNDTLVNKDSVHNIYVKPCLACPRTLLQTLSGEDFFYTHFELGSPESLEILATRILPQVNSLTLP